MTGYTVHTGTSEKFSTGWDRIFGGDESTGKGAKKKKKAKKSAVKASDKPAAKKK